MFQSTNSQRVDYLDFDGSHTDDTLESCFFRCQVCDAFQNYIWEPVLVKESALNAATEAACLILSIDETVKNPQLGHPKQADHLTTLPTPLPTGFPYHLLYDQRLKRTDGDGCGFCGCVPLRQSEKPQGGPKGKGKGKAPCNLTIFGVNLCKKLYEFYRCKFGKCLGWIQTHRMFWIQWLQNGQTLQFVGQGMGMPMGKGRGRGARVLKG